jgi:hypothetical protein
MQPLNYLERTGSSHLPSFSAGERTAVKMSGWSTTTTGLVLQGENLCIPIPLGGEQCEKQENLRLYSTLEEKQKRKLPGRRDVPVIG